MKSSRVWIELLLAFLIQIKIIAMEPAWYETSDGKRFLIDEDEKYNWYQAWNECARYDAQLIAIESEEKNQILMKLLKNTSGKPKHLWIGGLMFYNKVSFYWAVNEQEFIFTNWATDNVHKFGIKQQCVYLMRQKKDIPWDFANCDDKKLGFICEEIIIREEVATHEAALNTDSSKGSMYKGSIYGLIG